MQKNYEDITKEWKNKKYQGKVLEAKYYMYNKHKYCVDSKNVYFNYSNKEKFVAQWLVKNYGGILLLIPKIDKPNFIKTPDYVYKNNRWDLKTMSQDAISEKRAVDNVIKNAKNQTDNIILDITETKLSTKNIINQVIKVYSDPHRKWLNKIMIIKKYKLIKVFKRK